MFTHALVCAAFMGVLFFGNSLFAALNGTYTINAGAPASATNYQSVSAAVSDLVSGTRSDGGPVNGPGVSGPVTLRITAGSGPYTEQVSFGAISGTSVTNFVRLTGGPTRETITYGATTTTDRHVIRLSGANNVILDSLTIDNTGTTYGYGVWLTANSDNNIVQNCMISVLNSSTSSNFAGITLSGTTPTTTGNNGDFNLIQNNTISGGYYGIACNGTNTTTFSEGNMLLNNVVNDFYYYGIRYYEQRNGMVAGNEIYARSNATTANYGIYSYYFDNIVIERNHLYNMGTYSIYVAYANYIGGATGNRSAIRNNFIGGSHINTGTNYGIYMTTNSFNVDVFHNSVSLTTGNGRCIYILSGSGNDVRNNSFSLTNSTSGYAAYVSSTAYITTMDYNNYYAPGSSNYIYVGSAYSNTTFQGGGGYNTNSNDGDPNYIDPVNNLHAFAVQLWDQGDPTVPVSNDYDGDVRPNPFSTLPDIGADEYVPDSIDIKMEAILEPGDNICPDSFQTVSVIISNKGLNTQSSIPIYVAYSGITTGVLTTTYTSALPLGGIDTVLVGTVNTWPGGTLNLSAYSAVPGDQTLNNDTLNTSRAISPTVAAPSGSPATICAGDSTVIMAASGGNNYWFDAAQGGTLVASGDTLWTGALSTSTNYYVEARGMSSNSITTTYANNNSCGGGNMFEITAYNEITIDSFALHLQSTGSNSEARVYYKMGGYTGAETTPGAWTFLDSAFVTSLGIGTPTPLPIGGLTIPAGQTYAIYIYNPNVVYSNLGTTFTNADMGLTVGVGLCGLFSGTNNPRAWNGTVFYTAEGCASQRTVVPVTVAPTPVVSLMDTANCGPLTLDAGNGGGSATYLWSTGGTNQTEVINTSGNYAVTVTDGLCSDSDSAAITINTIPAVNLGSDVLLCDGVSASLDAQNPGQSYAWSTGDTTQMISVNMAGTYAVSVTTADGCTNMDDIIITTENSPVGSISADTSLCPIIAFTGGNTGGAALTGTWNFGDGNTSTAANPTHTYGGNGNYTVTFIQSNDCGEDTVTYNVDISCLVSISEEWASNVAMFPNPTKGEAMIQLSVPGTAQMVLTVSDLQGRVLQTALHTLVAGNNDLRVDMSYFSNGMYIIRLASDKFNWQGRLVRQ